MTAEAAFDTPNYAATSARLRGPDLGDDPDGDNPLDIVQEYAPERPEAELAEAARRVREFEKTSSEIKAMQNAFAALRDLDMDSLSRALPWLNDRLFAQERFHDDPPAS